MGGFFASIPGYVIDYTAALNNLQVPQPETTPITVVQPPEQSAGPSLPPVVPQSVDLFGRIWSIITGRGDPGTSVDIQTTNGGVRVGGFGAMPLIILGVIALLFLVLIIRR